MFAVQIIRIAGWINIGIVAIPSAIALLAVLFIPPPGDVGLWVLGIAAVFLFGSVAGAIQVALARAVEALITIEGDTARNLVQTDQLIAGVRRLAAQPAADAANSTAVTGRSRAEFDDAWRHE